MSAQHDLSTIDIFVLKVGLLEIVLRIEEGEDFILNIHMNSEREEEFTKHFGSQAPN